jgi:hypothetical protein
MHGTGVKIIEALQAKIWNNYKNTRLKLRKMHVAILVNKICKTKQLTPKYFSIKTNRNKRSSTIICQLIVHWLVIVQN